MYAERVTEAMQSAIGETERRRAIQEAYNREHGITPSTIVKAVQDTIRLRSETEEQARRVVERLSRPSHEGGGLAEVVAALEKEMREAAAALEFERAAQLRDEIQALRKAMAQSG